MNSHFQSLKRTLNRFGNPVKSKIIAQNRDGVPDVYRPFEFAPDFFQVFIYLIP